MRRRRDYLSKRIDEYKGGSASRDEAEFAALQWAIQIVEEWIAEDPLFEIDWNNTEYTEHVTSEEVEDLLGREARYLDRRVEIVAARIVPRKKPRTVRLIMRYLEPDEQARRRPKRGLPPIVTYKT